LLIISILIFTVIQAPPGDYISAKIEEMERAGEEANMAEIESLRRAFWLDDPQYVRYARWMGFTWFAGFKDQDRGLLQGYLGRSMQTGQPVNKIVGERLAFTFLIAFFSVLFTWGIAIPIGIYSACRQYSWGDYLFTFLGFIGMSIPGFLLAILLMYGSETLFGFTVSGLFSAEFAAQPGMSWAKFVDLLKHIWVPIVIMGMSGTAGMIRVMRANLLDELNKPYVITAEAKGLHPLRLLLKYPVRVALNPFISGIGGLLPTLISGGAIVAVTLSLPTVGPLLLDAIMAQDVYFAASLLMLLTTLSVIGTLFSDILLILLDPRIRQGRSG
ncbi:MAG: ABC transporter permease, partial [Lentisphaerae bacterium]